MTQSGATGWGAVSQPALLVSILVVVAGVGYGTRALLAPAVPLLPPSLERLTTGPARLVVDTTFPQEKVDLLWLEGRVAHPTGTGTRVVLDGTSRVLTVDTRLRIGRPTLELEGRPVLSVALGASGWWVATGTNEILRLDLDGSLEGSSPSPFDFASIAIDPLVGDPWLVRSTQMFSFRWDPAPAPLAIRLGSNRRPDDSLGTAVVPDHVLLRELANAGHLAVRGDTLYYAPFIRDQLVALTTTGDTLWTLVRGLPQSTPDPRFEMQDGEPVIDYHPVNLGLTVGPDDRLYLLSTPGFTTSESRLDVIDPSSGEVVWTGGLPTALPTVAVNRLGRVYSLDPFRLLSGVAVAEREPIPPLDLELLGGGRLTTADLTGRVSLVNFWASWCEPCREEMPALDSLRRSIHDPDFQFVTINEDVDPEDAADFLREFGFDFPAGLGRGAMKAAYHYRGLPFTILIDREGRVVQRWVGFTGSRQIDLIRTVVQAELGRSQGSGTDQHRAGPHHPEADPFSSG